MANKFKIKDCVILDSTPNTIMTIEDDSKAPQYICVWLKKKILKKGKFDENLLTKIKCPSNKPLGIYVR